MWGKGFPINIHYIYSREKKFIEELKDIIGNEVHIYRYKEDKIQSICICRHLLKANKRISQPFEFKRLNKITRNIELFMKDHCKGECKELLKIIEMTHDSRYILDYPK